MCVCLQLASQLSQYRIYWMHEQAGVAVMHYQLSKCF